MLGVLCYKLRAETGASVPLFHGRLLHAAAFSLLDAYDAALAARVHDHMNLKPFTVSLLQETGGTPSARRGENPRVAASRGDMVSTHGGYANPFGGDDAAGVRTGQGRRGAGQSRGAHGKDARAAHGAREFPQFEIVPGACYFWRVTGLSEEVLNAFLAVQTGTVLEIGRARLRVEEVIADGRRGTGVTSGEEILAGAFSAPRVASITFHFRSPVAFRNFDRDYPFPLPELVFGSLADKWQGANLPGDFSRDAVRELASAIALTRWRGESKSVYLGHDRGMLGFTGDFSYDIAFLPDEERSYLLALAQFAPFAGVGRLAAQGFGWTEVEFSGKIKSSPKTGERVQ